MASRRTYNLEQFYSTFVLADESDGEASLSGSDTPWEPVDTSGTLTDTSDDEVLVTSRSRARRIRPQVAEMEESQDSVMEQSEGTSADTASGVLASTSGLVRLGPGRGRGRIRTRAVVTPGGLASPRSAVPAGPVASRRRAQQPPGITVRRVHSALPEMLAAPDWQPTTSAAHVMPPFTAQPGIQVETANLTPLDFLELFLTEDLVQYIVDQSNLYATQFIAANPDSPLARPFEWRPISVSNFKTFLGLTLNMGITKKHVLRSYWSTEPHQQMSIYSATMSRNRYELILRFLHFNNNELCHPRGDPGYDRLHKIRPLINHFNQKFADLYIPQQNVCVDESLMPFHGRLSFKQYIPSKRAKYGVKMYKLCERATGYTCSFRVYEGKDSRLEPPNCPDYMGSSGKIVWDLVSPLFHKGYHLYVDNFYTSVPLFKHLFLNQIGCCGTARPNRQGFPQRLVQSDLRRGERACLRNDELLAMKWTDKRDVFVLSSIHPDTTVQIVTRTGIVEKPLAVHEYNRNMGGVDYNDQMLAPYLINRKSRRWYKKVSIYLFQLAMYNAFVLFKLSGGDGFFMQFQESIIKALLFPQGAILHAPQPDAVRRLHERHFAYYLPSTASRKRAQKRCRVCAKHRIRRDTTVYCPHCPDQPGLCLGECFERYHTLLDY